MSQIYVTQILRNIFRRQNQLNEVKLLKNQPVKQVMSILALIFFLSLTALPFSTVSSAGIHFVYAEPGAWTGWGESFPVRIYKFDESTRNISVVWNFADKSEFVKRVNVFPKLDIVTILTSKDGKLALRLLKGSESNVIANITVGSIATVVRHDLIIDEVGNLQIAVRQRDGALQKGYVTQKLLGAKNIIPQSLSPVDAEYRLGGPAPPYGSVADDVVTARIDTSGRVIPISAEIVIDGSLIPENMHENETSRIWIIITNEHEYRALMSTPTNKDLSDNIRILLLHDRKRDKWNRLQIVGSATALRPVNNWLAGVVSSMHPDTDLQRRVTKPPIWEDRVVLVNPLRIENFTVTLGKGCEVLWIEGEVVYYRVGTTLFKAEISNNDFINRVKLIDDPVIEHFHWAYRSQD